MAPAVLVNIRPLHDAAGNITGAVNCFHEITERRHSEQEYVLTRDQVEELTVKLTQERDQSRALIDAQPAAIYTTDAAGLKMVKARMAKSPENVAWATLEPRTFDLTRRSGYSSPGVSCTSASAGTTLGNG